MAGEAGRTQTEGPASLGELITAIEHFVFSKPTSVERMTILRRLEEAVGCLIQEERANIELAEAAEEEYQ